ncbi:MAG: LytTR family DNA-binding domain-containing protein [Saprospiraceae bacterium]
MLKRTLNPLLHVTQLQIPPNYYHPILGGLLGLWLYVLLVFLAPFDTAPISFMWRVKLMFGYGVIFALTYQLAHLLEERLLGRLSAGWWTRQFLLLLIFVLLNFPPVYWYYKSPIVLGEYALWDFMTQVYLTTFAVVIPLLLFGRRRIKNILFSDRGQNQVLLRGENKLDVLQLSPEELLFVETARNYVQVHYRKDGMLQSKLLRTSLRKVAVEHPALMQVHRSYLVNPNQITCWQDAKSIMVHGSIIPVSDSYRARVVEQFSIYT